MVAAMKVLAQEVIVIMTENSYLALIVALWEYHCEIRDFSTLLQTMQVG